MDIKKLKQAFRYSLPICTGFIVLGIAFAMVMQDAGWPGELSVLMSLVIYAGSMQFALVPLLVSGDPIWMAAFLTLMVNARMMFYGFAFLKEFKQMGWRFPYMIFALTDETFSVLLGLKTTQQYDGQVAFYVSILHHVYWVVGTLIGVLVGNVIPFDTKGIDFSLTALFIVIWMNQWKATKNKSVFYVVFSISIASLCIVGPRYFLLPSILLSIIWIWYVQEFKRVRGIKKHD